MALVWIRAKEDFRYKAECEQIARRLADIEAVAGQLDAVHAARELQMMLAVIVDQLERSRTEYVQPSLFQRMLVQSWVENERIATLLDEATRDLPEGQGGALKNEWSAMQSWFAVLPEEKTMVNAIVRNVKK